MKNITEVSVLPTLEFKSRRLSLKHEKANERRIIQKANEVVNNILAVGRMQKMNLIAINNRSISIYSKVKRAEQSLNRAHSQGRQQLAHINQQFKLNLRSQFTQPHSQQRQLTQHLKIQHDGSFNTNQISPSKLSYQQYAPKLRAQENQGGKNENEMQTQEHKRQNHSQINHKKPKQVKSASIIKQQTVSDRQRVLFAHQYKQNLQKINQMAAYESKLRQMKEKMFLRKLKEAKKRSKHSK